MTLKGGGLQTKGLTKLSVGIVNITIDLSNTLNGDTVDITFYEDVDSTGTYENTETFTLTETNQTLYPDTLVFSEGNSVYWELEATDDGDVTTAAEDITVTLNY